MTSVSNLSKDLGVGSWLSSNQTLAWSGPGAQSLQTLGGTLQERADASPRENLGILA